MEEVKQKFNEGDLHSKTYRDLQKIAKEMKLPSNVKKVQMINLILTNINGPIEKIKALIDDIKKDRARQAQLRKRRTKRKAKKLSLTISSRSQSPVITTTPKRSPTPTIRLWCDDQYNYAPPVIPGWTYHHSKDKKPPIDDVPNSNANGQLKGRLTEYQRKKTITNYSNVEDCQTKMVLRNRSAKGKYQDKAITRNKLTPVTVKQTIERVTHGCTSVKRVVVASSYRPLTTGAEKKDPNTKKTTKEIDIINKKTYTYELISGGISIKNKDGVVSKVSAYIKKPCLIIANTPNTESNKENTRQYKRKSIQNTKYIQTQNIDILDINNQTQKTSQTTTNNSLLKTLHRNQNDNISDNNNLDCIQNQNNNVQYEATDINFGVNTSYNHTPMSMVGNEQIQQVRTQNSELMTSEEITDYFHKKIRAESVRTRRATLEQRVSRNEEDGRLPVSGDVTQPLYVHCAVDNTATTPYYSVQEHQTYLEPLYNLPNQYLCEPPLERCKTTSSTYCVFTAPLCTSSKLHNSTSEHIDQANLAPYIQQNECNNTSNQTIYNSMQTADQDVSMRNDYSSRELDSEGTGNESELPDMVADAFEIISQDGDYMEQMGMDVRMQCILCSWAGPKMILEHHLLKEHSNIIRSVTSEEWRLECKLSEQSCLELLQTRHGAIFVVSTSLLLNTTLQVAFASIADYDIPTRGSITIYNKLTGQPFIWEGEIPNLPPTMEYEPQSTNCFVLPVSQLDLIPNSANLKLINGKLSPESAGVVIGDCDMNDLIVEIFFKIYVYL